MEKLTSQSWKEILAAAAAVFEENCEFLCGLDAQMGDGDLSLTMKKGYAAAAEAAAALEEPGIGKLLMKVGMKMSSAVPSTMGTLMSSGLMTGGKALGDRQEMGAAELALFLGGFCDGIIKRGKCAVGDRTILDALDAARQAAVKAAKQGGTLEDVAIGALKGAEEGVERTKSMTPKFGKAAVFAAKAVGTADQGAIAGKLLIGAIQSYICY